MLCYLLCFATQQHDSTSKYIPSFYSNLKATTMSANPAEEFFEACPEVKEMMLSMREAFGPFKIVDIKLDRLDGEGVVQTYPNPNIIR